MITAERASALDWGRRFALDDQSVVFHSRNSECHPRVTIGMPTYKRAITIRRALRAISRQTFREFVLIVSDNAGEDPATLAVMREIAPDLPEVYLVAQRQNIGALANLNLLLGLAETEYFMWLADDDEITENYLAELVGVLDRDRKLVAAMGTWRKMRNAHEFEYGAQHRSTEADRAARIFRYVAFGRDDTLFYGLHRTECLRRGNFGGYFWPNRGVLSNWCYVFLFDLIWQGPMGYVPEATWISHDYTEKLYEKAGAVTITDRLKTLARRVNVYLLYCAKTARKNPLMLPIVFAASMIGFAGDIVSALARFTYRGHGRIKNGLKS